MFSLPVFVLLAFASSVTAQSAGDNVALDLAAIKAHFQGAGLVPSFLPTFEPAALLNVTYTSVGSISPGQLLTAAQVSAAPLLTVTPANSSVPTSGSYTIAMVDANTVGTDQTGGQTRHWLVNGATINGNNVTDESGTIITAYAGPAPPAGSGPHRYVILIYSQPPGFTPPGDLAPGVGVFDFNDYVRTSGLGPLLAANYLTVSEGAANASLSQTSAVVTSTLSVPSAARSSASGTTPSPSQTKSSGATSLPVTTAMTFAFAAAIVALLV